MQIVHKHIKIAAAIFVVKAKRVDAQLECIYLYKIENIMDSAVLLVPRSEPTNRELSTHKISLSASLIF